MLRFVIALMLAGGAVGQQAEQVDTRELTPPATGSETTAAPDTATPASETGETTTPAPAEAEAETEDTADAEASGGEPDDNQQQAQEITRPTAQRSRSTGRPVAAFWLVRTPD